MHLYLCKCMCEYEYVTGSHNLDLKYYNLRGRMKLHNISFNSFFAYVNSVTSKSANVTYVWFRIFVNVHIKIN